MNMNLEPKGISRRSFLKAAGVVSAAGALAACGGKSGGSAAPAAGDTAVATANSTGTKPLKEFYTFETQNRELEEWNILHSQAAADFNVENNLVDGLLSADCYGKIAPAIAESWEHDENATVWTFHLRKDVNWSDRDGNVKADLTSKDFLVGLEWVLNAHKNDAANTSMPNETIAGAKEYYDYTAGLTPEEAYKLTYEDMLAKGVGIEAPDDYTVIYSCINPCPYFDTIACYVCCYPAAPALIEELGIEGFKYYDYTNMWYCGPYYIEEFIQSNSKSFVSNPNWYGAKDHTRFERVVCTMISGTDVGYQLYENRELDEIDLGESTLTTITKDPNHKYYNQLCEKRPRKYSYQMHLNYQKKLADGSDDINWNKAVANLAFRQCFYRGLDLSKYLSRYNLINPFKCENLFYTMPGVCFNADGVEYTELVRQKMYFANEKYDAATMIRTRGQDISSLKKQAMEELSAIGVTFPVSCDFYILASSQAMLDNANVLKQCFSESFGDDFIVLNIGTYVSSVTKEVRNPQIASFVQNGWGADFGDPVNFLGQEVLHDDNAYYSRVYSNISKVDAAGWADYQQDLKERYETFTDMVTKAKSIVSDVNARYDAFAEAEAYLLDNVLCCPAVYEISWCLTHANEYSKINAMYGPVNYKYVDWETSEEAYTTEQYAAFAEAYEAAKNA